MVQPFVSAEAVDPFAFITSLRVATGQFVRRTKSGPQITVVEQYVAALNQQLLLAWRTLCDVPVPVNAEWQVSHHRISFPLAVLRNRPKFSIGLASLLGRTLILVGLSGRGPRRHDSGAGKTLHGSCQMASQEFPHVSAARKRLLAEDDGPRRPQFTRTTD